MKNNLAWLGTWWGHLIVQAVVAGVTVVIQGITGHDWGAYQGLVQGAAAVVSEGVVVVKTHWGS